MNTLIRLSSIVLVMAATGCASYLTGPPPSAHLAGVTLPNQTLMYTEDQCIGAVVNGVCHGSVIGQPIGTCHGSVLNGKCIGVEMPNNSNPGSTSSGNGGQARTHQEMMQQSKPPTHDDMMRQSRPPTHQDMMCTSNPFNC